MFRALIQPAFRSVSVLATNQTNLKSAEVFRKFSQLSIQPITTIKSMPVLKAPSLLSHPLIPQLLVPQRNYIKHSRQKGKRKTVKHILMRFKRLDFGIWIRTRAGRFKRMWKKTQKQRYRSRQHVFCNASQSNMLDKMVCNYWKKPRYWLDDPYRPYHMRESFSVTRRKPIEWE